MKQAQITMFIILGLVLMLVLGAVVYVVQKPREAELPSVLRAPIAFQPVQDFVTQCLQDTLKKGLIVLGQHGGIIPEISSAPSINLHNPTNGEGVTLSPDDPQNIIPYWYYVSSPNSCISDCQHSSAIPTIASMQSQLNEFIKAHMNDCLQGFTALPEFQITAGQLVPDVRMTEHGVVAMLQYPLKIVQGSTAHEIDSFAAQADVPLKRMIDVASELVLLESNYSYLEKNFLQTLQLFSGKENDDFPPFYDLELGFGKGTIWIKNTVKQRVKELLTVHTPLLQAQGTNNYKYIFAPDKTITGTIVRDPKLFELLYNRDYFIPLKNPSPDISVRFLYLDWWEPFFELNCRGQLCMSESIAQTFGFIFGMKRYAFTYDVSYPVLVTLESPLALNGDGYTFNFALEANIRSNEPISSAFVPQQAELTQQSLLCDHRNSGNITISVNDARTKKPLEDIVVTFSCGSESCMIGNTGKLVEKLPVCIGGMLNVIKDDYAPISIAIDTEAGKDSAVHAELEPYRELEVSFKKIKIKKEVYEASGVGEAGAASVASGTGGTGGASTTPAPTYSEWNIDTTQTYSLSSKESVVVSLDRITDDGLEPVSAFAQRFGDAKEDAASIKTARLIPGKYRVQITAQDRSQIVIPEENRKVRSSPFSKAKSIRLPKIEFNQTNAFYEGGAEFEITLTPRDLEHKKIELKFFSIAIKDLMPDQRQIDDLDQISKISDYSMQYEQLLEPALS